MPATIVLPVAENANILILEIVRQALRAHGDRMAAQCGNDAGLNDMAKAAELIDEEGG